MVRGGDNNSVHILLLHHLPQIFHTLGSLTGDFAHNLLAFLDSTTIYIADVGNLTLGQFGKTAGDTFTARINANHTDANLLIGTSNIVIRFGRKAGCDTTQRQGCASCQGGFQKISPRSHSFSSLFDVSKLSLNFCFRSSINDNHTSKSANVIVLAS